MLGKISKNLFLSLLLVLFTANAAYCASDEVQFRAESVSGVSSSLDFGRFTSGQDHKRPQRVRVTIDQNPSDNTYEVKQVLVEPLTSASGKRLDDVLVFDPVEGTGLNGQVETYSLNTPVSENYEDLLYTSSGSALDNFDVDYYINWSKVDTSGEFTGRIRYWVKPQGATDSFQDIWVTLNTTKMFEIQAETSSFNDNELVISTGDVLKKNFIELTLPYNSAGFYSLIQQSDVYLLDEMTGQQIDLDIVKLKVEQDNGETDYNTYQALSQRDSIYTNKEGTSDLVRILLELDKTKLSALKAGIYNSRLIYSIEPAINGVAEKIIDLKVEIEPEFKIEVVSDFYNTLSFKGLESGMGPKEKEVMVKVTSNTHKPYTVIQKVNELFSDEMGNTIKEGAFTIRQEIDKSYAGEIEFSSEAGVSIGDTVIYSSDINGSPVEFKVLYSLDIPDTTIPGDYSSDISYSLVEK